MLNPQAQVLQVSPLPRMMSSCCEMFSNLPQAMSKHRTPLGKGYKAVIGRN
jgi:hypothetical protein